jgi:hypothetical protein
MPQYLDSLTLYLILRVPNWGQQVCEDLLHLGNYSGTTAEVLRACAFPDVDSA